MDSLLTLKDAAKYLACNHATPVAIDYPYARGVERVRAAAAEYFPGLWPAVDLALSVAATLLLTDNQNPVALVLVGGPSWSKTTVADMIADHPVCYVSDNFTPASFVSHAANVNKKQLEKVDLLPRIKHKVLVTPELAPIFRGKEDELANRFSIITRVLDGHGLKTDSGTHGQRGYRGDYMFAWIGCTTPFEGKVWRVMAQLGSRLFFLVMDDQPEPTIGDLMRAGEGLSYGEKLSRVKDTVHQSLTVLFDGCGGVRGVNWDAEGDPLEVRERIARLAKLVAVMRSEPLKECDPSRSQFEYTPAKIEQPWRANAVLQNLARGHALVHGRRQLSEDDLPLVAKVTVSSMPPECAAVFRALVASGGRVQVAEVQSALRVKQPETARGAIRQLEQRGVAEVSRPGPGRPDEARFTAEWAWCGSGEFQAMLFGDQPPIRIRGVCAVTNNLAQRQMEGEGEKAETHTPGEMIGASDGDDSEDPTPPGEGEPCPSVDASDAGARSALHGVSR